MPNLSLPLNLLSGIPSFTAENSTNSTNGLNYTMNAEVNTISSGTGSAANTISGGGNIANPNRILNNPADATCAYRTISGGYDNTIGSTNNGDGAISSTIAGGSHHRIRRPTDSSDNPNPAIVGTQPLSGAPRTTSFTLDQPDHGTISGGGYNAIRNGNYGVIAGGSSNIIQGENATYMAGYAAAISGGEGNEATGNNSVVAGGGQNTCRASRATISGGSDNSILADLFSDTTIGNTQGSVIGGGVNNDIKQAGYATISGGSLNKIGEGASTTNADYGTGSTIGGGVSNVIGGGSTAARYSNITGGNLNTVNTWWSSVVGGYNNLVGPSSFPQGEYSVAVGRDAECQHHMTFCIGGGLFSGSIRGSAQTQTTVLKCSTANATPTVLIPGGTPANSGEMAMPSDCAWAFRVMIIGRQTNANTVGAWEVTGVATNDTGTAAIVGTPTVTALVTAPAGWGAPDIAFSTSRIQFRVTGHATNSIKWVARAEITQVIG